MFISTSPFAENESFYTNQALTKLAVPARDSRDIMKAADTIFIPGHRYQRAGVILTDFRSAAVSQLMDTPWFPPSGEVVGEISEVFDCEVRHSYSEPVSGLSGYDCYDGGEHVGGYKGAAGASQPGQVLYLVSDEPAILVQEAASYREVWG